MVKLDKKEWKDRYFKRLTSLINEFGKVIIIKIENVRSKQMQKVRIALRGKAELLMGKNTMIRKCLREMVEERPEIETLLENVKGNVGFCFTDMDPSDLQDIFKQYEEQSSARPGIIAPVDVVIPAGPTGMGPEKTSFFQALNIQTKIAKGSIEILNAVTVVEKASKVGLSEAKLLNMLNISPFWYSCEVLVIMDGTDIYPAAVLAIKPEDIRAKILGVVLESVAPLSLAINMPNAASAPHMILNAFKNCLAVAVETAVTFKEAEGVKAYLENPEAFQAANAGNQDAGGAEEKKEEAPAAEEESDDDDDMDFGLFD